MPAPPPVLSVCIPTFNRADLLAYTLDGLRELERFGTPFEIVISDNQSTDDTAEMLEQRMRTAPYLRLVRQARRTPVSGGLANAARNARGKFVVFHADDDSVMARPLLEYVARMESESDLAAVYSDWIAYDDEQGTELARYFVFRTPAVFEPGEPLELVEFALRNFVYPEVAVYRREALLRSQCLVRRGDYFAHLWMYQLSRLGRVAFELEPFYREHRGLKTRFRRDAHWSNWSMRLHLIGDELRNELETVVLWALQDAPPEPVSHARLLVFRALIDRFLESRIDQEIQRAAADKDWLLASELQRRCVLWRGPGKLEEQRRVFFEVTFPAALQHVHELYRTLSGVSGVLLRGFRKRRVRDFLEQHYPEMKILEAESDSLRSGRERPLVVDKYESPDSETAHAGEYPEYRVSLERLLKCNRVQALPIDLSAL